MNITFEYESIHDEISFEQFTNELHTYCGEIVPEYAIHFIEERAYTLYEERVLVKLVHMWSGINDAMDDLIAMERTSCKWYEQLHEEYSHLAQIIAEML